MEANVWKLVHLLGACLFVGNIVVSAFWKVMADRTGELAVMRFGVRLVNLTDALFTGVGATMLAVAGHALAGRWGGVGAQGWIVTSYALFAFSGALWIAVLVPIQIRQARLLRAAVDRVPPQYRRLDRIWSTVGVVATLVPLPAVWMMLAKGA